MYFYTYLYYDWTLTKFGFNHNQLVVQYYTLLYYLYKPSPDPPGFHYINVLYVCRQ